MSIINNVKVVSGNLIDVTRQEALDLITNNALIVNASYRISGTCSYFFTDSAIILTAKSTNKFDSDGLGEFYVPIFGQSSSNEFKGVWNNLMFVELSNINNPSNVSVFYSNEPVNGSSGGQAAFITNNILHVTSGPWFVGDTITSGYGTGSSALISNIFSTPGYSPGHVTRYGGKYWINQTGLFGTDITDQFGGWNGGLFLDNTNWQPIPFSNSQYYEKVVNKVTYYLEYDIITYREDNFGNRVYENNQTLQGVITYNNINSIFNASNILYFDWNNPVVLANYIDKEAVHTIINTPLEYYVTNKHLSGQSLFHYSCPYGQPRCASKNSYVQGNTFKNGGGENLRGYNFNISNNIFEAYTRFNGVGSFYITDNKCRLELDCSGFGSGSIGSNTCNVNISSCASSTNSSIGVYNNYGNGTLNVYNSRFDGGFYIEQNTCVGDMNIYDSTFYRANIRYNEVNDLYFSQNSILNCNINYNKLNRVEFMQNTFDCRSFNGYDPQKGFCNNTFNAKNIFAFTEMSTKFNYNSFTGRSGFSNNIVINSLYFQSNYGDNFKINNNEFINASFLNNNLNNSYFEKNTVRTSDIQNNQGTSAYIRINTFEGNVMNNNFNSSYVEYNIFSNAGQLNDNYFASTNFSYSNITAGSGIGRVSAYNCTFTKLIMDQNSSFYDTYLNGCTFDKIRIIEGSNFSLAASNTLYNKVIISLTVQTPNYLQNDITNASIIYSQGHGPRRLISQGYGTQTVIEYFNGNGFSYEPYTT